MPRKRKLVKDLTRDEFIARYVWKRARLYFRYWPQAIKALERQRLSKGLYLCEGCKKAKKSSEIDRHHREPIGKKEGKSWDELFERLFCDTSNIVVLCRTCHKDSHK